MGEKQSQGPIGKLAARAKAVQQKLRCPQCGGEAEHVMYHGSMKKGRPGVRCQKCNVIFLTVKKGRDPETVFLADEHHVTGVPTPKR